MNKLKVIFKKSFILLQSSKMSNIQDILSKFEKGSLVELDKKQTEIVLNHILELQSEIEELTGCCSENEKKKRDPKTCDCGWRGNYVLVNGRCPSCM